MRSVVKSHSPVLQAGTYEVTETDAAGTIEFRIKNDGSLEGYWSGDGSTDDFGRWIYGVPRSGEWSVNAAFVDATDSIGTGGQPQSVVTGTFGSDLDLATTRTWSIGHTKSPGGSESATIDFTFKRGGITFPAVRVLFR